LAHNIMTFDSVRTAK